MIKNYIIDTNVMIHDPMFLYNFQDNHLILPLVTVEELDGLKKASGILGYNARQVLKELNKVRQYGDFVEGIKLPNGGVIRIEINFVDNIHLPDGMDTKKNDNRILAVAKAIAQSDTKRKTILVTKDMCMTVKADAMGLEVQDYETDKVRTDDLYKGYSEIMMPSESINKIFSEGLKIPSGLEEEVYPNHFFHIKSKDQFGHEVLA